MFDLLYSLIPIWFLVGGYLIWRAWIRPLFEIDEPPELADIDPHLAASIEYCDAIDRAERNRRRRKKKKIVQSSSGKFNVQTVDGMRDAVKARLKDFNISTNRPDVIVRIGPRVITIGFEPGGDFNDDSFKKAPFNMICRTLAQDPADCQFLSSLPGKYKSFVGIEIPIYSKKFQPVDINDLLKTPDYTDATVPLILGRNTFNDATVMDLGDSRNAHCFIAGTTGAGKTTLVDSIIYGVLRMSPKYRPALVLCDAAKGGEDLGQYRHALNLYAPFIDGNEAAQVTLLHLAKALPDRKRTDRKILVIVDELPALIDPDSNPYADDCRYALIEIGRLGRSKGVHMVLLTQDLSADLLKGQMKNNVKGRVALMTGTNRQTNQILGDGWQVDASKLLGLGDMYTVINGNLQRVQAPLPDSGVIGAWLRANALPDGYQYPFDWRIYAEQSKQKPDGGIDPVIRTAAEVVVRVFIATGKCPTIKEVQDGTGKPYRQVRETIFPALEKYGIVGASQGAGKEKGRPVYVRTLAELQAKFN